MPPLPYQVSKLARVGTQIRALAAKAAQAGLLEDLKDELRAAAGIGSGTWGSRP